VPPPALQEGNSSVNDDKDDMSHAVTHIKNEQTSYYLKKKGYQNHKSLSARKSFKNGFGYTR